ncbi:MAG TPA: helix-turn-helix domain-containing protein [Methanomethylovorans sp.]|nr:helix-turn-helix domain-containing protein [Methanomethylovorans sp.]
MSRKGKLSSETKLELVERYLKGEISQSRATNEAAVDSHTFIDWLRLYDVEGPSGLLTKTKNTIYSKETKLSAVNSYLSGEGSLKDICRKYKIRGEFQLREWIKRYNSHEDLKSGSGGGSHMRKARQTTPEERLTIVYDCLANDKNYGAMALKYNISYQQVRNWIKNYEKMGSAGLEDRRGRRAGTQPSRTPEEALHDRISQLEREKQDLQMENDLLKKVRELERGNHYL